VPSREGLGVPREALQVLLAEIARDLVQLVGRALCVRAEGRHLTLVEVPRGAAHGSGHGAEGLRRRALAVVHRALGSGLESLRGRADGVLRVPYHAAGLARSVSAIAVGRAGAGALCVLHGSSLPV
jgi:hypothetical protein